MADTPNHEYNVPDQGDQNWHNPLNENFEAFEVDITSMCDARTATSEAAGPTEQTQYVEN